MKAEWEHYEHPFNVKATPVKGHSQLSTVKMAIKIIQDGTGKTATPDIVAEILKSLVEASPSETCDLVKAIIPYKHRLTMGAAVSKHFGSVKLDDP